MIDKDVIEQLGEDVQKAVESAVLTIAGSGVLELQRRQNFARVLSGPVDEPVGDLAERILQHRRREAAMSEFWILVEQIRSKVK